MCLGLVMTVLDGDEASAMVAWGDERRRVSMLLIGAQPPGTEVLVHVDMAVRVVDAQEAILLRDAITGLIAAQRGEDFEHLFADLIGREPELPPHLRPGGASAPEEDPVPGPRGHHLGGKP